MVSIYFSVDGIEYKTAEHFMMAQKAALFQDDEIFEQILNVDHPEKLKHWGEKANFITQPTNIIIISKTDDSIPEYF